MKTKIKYCLMGGLIAASLTGFNSCQLESEIYDSINAGMFPKQKQTQRLWLQPTDMECFNPTAMVECLMSLTEYR